MKTIIITGEKAEGKTSFLLKIVYDARKRAVKTGGILSLRIMQNEVTIGYDVLDISTEKRVNLLSDKPIEAATKIGKFYFHQSGLEFGNQVIEKSIQDSHLIFLDEIGKSELENSAWHEALNNIILHFNGTLILAVRKSFVQEVCEKYQFLDFQLLDIANSTVTDFWKLLDEK